MDWAARFVAPVAECSLGYGVALRAGIQTDDSVGAESECQHLGPKPASGTDVDDPTATVPLKDAPDEPDGLGARERPAKCCDVQCSMLEGRSGAAFQGQ